MTPEAAGDPKNKAWYTWYPQKMNDFDMLCASMLCTAAWRDVVAGLKYREFETRENIKKGGFRPKIIASN